MVDEEIIKYIKEQLAKGFSVNDIRNYLVNGGYYTQGAVDEAIVFLNNQSRKPVQQQKEEEPSSNIKSVMNSVNLSGIKEMPLKSIILYIVVIIMGIIVSFKVLAYFEIFDFYALIGFDPFAVLGGAISGGFLMK